MGGNVGSGVAICKDGQLLEEGSYRISSVDSIYQAELVATVKGLELLNSCNIDASEHICIYSDTLSNSKSLDPLVATVHARRVEKKIRWYWVRAHIGTVCNERADFLAKSGTAHLVSINQSNTHSNLAKAGFTRRLSQYGRLVGISRIKRDKSTDFVQRYLS